MDIINCICPFRREKTPIKKTHLHPNKIICSQCNNKNKYELIRAKVWKVNYYFCNYKCWAKWCKTFN